MKFREQISEEMYEEALKDAQRITDKAMANPRVKDSTSELIEKQIEIAANFLERIERELAATGRLDAVCVLGACERLFQIVQNQQQQIKELQKSARAKRDVSMCVCGHSSDDHGLRHGCLLDDCNCKLFRWEANR